MSRHLDRYEVLERWQFSSLKLFLSEKDNYENDCYDFKLMLNEKAFQTINAFANTDGGFLFVGVEDLSSNPSGIERSDIRNEISQKLFDSGSGAINFEVKEIFHKENNPDNKVIYIVYVYRLTEKHFPVFYKGSIYHRLNGITVYIKQWYELDIIFNRDYRHGGTQRTINLLYNCCDNLDENKDYLLTQDYDAIKKVVSRLEKLSTKPSTTTQISETEMPQGNSL